jgi:hypothetical protein
MSGSKKGSWVDIVLVAWCIIAVICLGTGVVMAIDRGLSAFNSNTGMSYLPALFWLGGGIVGCILALTVEVIVEYLFEAAVALRDIEENTRPKTDTDETDVGSPVGTPEDFTNHYSPRPRGRMQGVLAAGFMYAGLLVVGIVILLFLLLR